MATMSKYNRSPATPDHPWESEPVGAHLCLVTSWQFFAKPGQITVQFCNHGNQKHSELDHTNLSGDNMNSLERSDTLQ